MLMIIANTDVGAFGNDVDVVTHIGQSAVCEDNCQLNSMLNSGLQPRLPAKWLTTSVVLGRSKPMAHNIQLPRESIQ